MNNRHLSKNIPSFVFSILIIGASLYPLKTNACVSDPVGTDLFTHAPTLLGSISSINPLGDTYPGSGNVVPREKSSINYPVPFGGGSNAYAVSAMADARIYMLMKSDRGSGVFDYSVYMNHTCSISSYVESLHELDANIVTHISTWGLTWMDTSGAGSGPWIMFMGRPGDAGPMMPVSAGSSLGVTRNYDYSWSIGVTDKRHINALGNPNAQRYPGFSDFFDAFGMPGMFDSYTFYANEYLYAKSFIDYLTPSGGLQDDWKSLSVSNPEEGGQAGWDTPGYLQGAWFNPDVDRLTGAELFDRQAGALSIIPSHLNPQTRIKVSLGNAASAGSLTGQALALLDPSNWSPVPSGYTPARIENSFFVTKDPGSTAVNPDPASVAVGTTVCYDLGYNLGSGHKYNTILFALDDVNILKIKYDATEFTTPQCADRHTSGFPAVDATWITYVRTGTLFTRHPVDITQVSSVSPLGWTRPASDQILPAKEMNFHYPRCVSSSDVPMPEGSCVHGVNAMGDGEVFMLVRQNDPGGSGYLYDVLIQHTADVSSEYKGLSTLSPAITAAIAAMPPTDSWLSVQTGDSSDTTIGPWVLALGQTGTDPKIPVSAGDAIGDIQNDASGWLNLSLGVRDVRLKNGSFVNRTPKHYPGYQDLITLFPAPLGSKDLSLYPALGNRYANAQCFMDYFADFANNSAWRSKLHLGSPRCGQTGWDKYRFLAGSWFNPEIDKQTGPVMDHEIGVLSFVPEASQPDTMLTISWGKADSGFTTPNLALLDPQNWSPPVSGVTQFYEGFHVFTDPDPSTLVNPDPGNITVGQLFCYSLSYESSGTQYNALYGMMLSKDTLAVIYDPTASSTPVCAPGFAPPGGGELHIYKRRGTPPSDVIEDFVTSVSGDPIVDQAMSLEEGRIVLFLNADVPQAIAANLANYRIHELGSPGITLNVLQADTAGEYARAALAYEQFSGDPSNPAIITPGKLEQHIILRTDPQIPEKDYVVELLGDMTAYSSGHAPGFTGFVPFYMVPPTSPLPATECAREYYIPFGHERVPDRIIRPGYSYKCTPSTSHEVGFQASLAGTVSGPLERNGMPGQPPNGSVFSVSLRNGYTMNYKYYDYTMAPGYTASTLAVGTIDHDEDAATAEVTTYAPPIFVEQGDVIAAEDLLASYPIGADTNNRLQLMLFNWDGRPMCYNSFMDSTHIADLMSWMSTHSPTAEQEWDPTDIQTCYCNYSTRSTADSIFDTCL